MNLLALSFMLAAAAAQPQPTVAAERVGDVYVVRAQFTAPVPRDVAWRVLTDYDHLACYVPSVRESRVVSRDASGLLLEQELQGKLLFFSRGAKVLLRVTESPQEALAFEDVSRSDFELYRGTWELSQMEGGLAVRYLLRAKPRRDPPVLGARAIEDGVAELLGALQAEMVARAARSARTAGN